MAGNTFGKLFTITTFGESHGPAIGVVIDGCPPRIKINLKFIQAEMAKRRPGKSKAVSQRKEADEPVILSGVFEGRTTGTPIMMLIKNLDAKSKDYESIKNKFRPGHADFTYLAKYGIRDYRGSGRASARETAARVAAGAIAKLVLAELTNIKIYSCIKQIGEMKFSTKNIDKEIKNSYFCLEEDKVKDIEKYITQLRKDGDSCGAIVRVEAHNMKAGLGEPVFDRLDADIAKALMSINAVKAVEIGAGKNAVTQKGTKHGDEMIALGKFASNNAGGILGGISTGQNIVADMTLKPTSSISTPKNTVDIEGKQTEIQTTGRHDPCVGLRAPAIAEAMLAIVLLDHYLRHKGQNSHLQE